MSGRGREGETRRTDRARRHKKRENERSATGKPTNGEKGVSAIFFCRDKPMIWEKNSVRTRKTNFSCSNGTLSFSNKRAHEPSLARKPTIEW